jgi:hypothetical protein
MLYNLSVSSGNAKALQTPHASIPREGVVPTTPEGIGFN